jgi:hypothetical protein
MLTELQSVYCDEGWRWQGKTSGADGCAPRSAVDEQPAQRAEQTGRAQRDVRELDEVVVGRASCSVR